MQFRLARFFGSTGFRLASAPMQSSEPPGDFGLGSRPVIRWIKGDGLDDPVTRTAIAQATRLFGAELDYCLSTHGLAASRVRKILRLVHAAG